MVTWLRLAVASYALNKVGVTRVFSGAGKLLVGFSVLFMASIFVGVSTDLFTVVLEQLPVPFSEIIVAWGLLVVSLFWFHRDGQRNDRFFNEYGGGALISLYSLKSVVGFSIITVGFVIEPLAIALGVVVSSWLLWRYDWAGRPHGIIVLGILLGMFAVASPIAPGDAVGFSISLIAAALVANRYSPHETGWSRGHPKWVWKFNWRKRMQLPVQPHPEYDGSVVNDVYPEEDDELTASDKVQNPGSDASSSNDDHEQESQSGVEAPTTTNSPQQSHTEGGRGSRRDSPDYNHSDRRRSAAESDTTQPNMMNTQNSTAGEQQAHQRQTMVEETEFDWEEPPEKWFENIGGYGQVKDQLREEVVLPVRDNNPGFDRYGIEPTRGVLFHGPPGTGKTMFARALANELNRPFVELSQADLTSEYINEGPQLVSNVFDEAQALGGVVFIDEAEQLLSERTGRNQHNEDQKVMNTFLSALSRDDQQFIVILTTNRRDLMDEAVLRPGRVDREIEVGLPDDEARLEILKTKLADIPHDLSVSDVEDIVAKTEGWSGADLDSLIANARREAAVENAPHLRLSHIDLRSVDRV